MSRHDASDLDQALLAQLLAEDGFDPAPEADPARLRADGEPVPATPGQVRLWTVEHLGGAVGEFNLGLAIRFNVALDTSRMARALQQLVRRHESLRARFSESGGEVRLQFDAPDAIALACHDIGAADLAQAMRAVASRPFDLARGGLMRADLFRPADSPPVLLLSFHHGIVDLWSAAIVLQDLTALYAREQDDSVPRLPPAVQFGDYAAGLRASAAQDGQADLREYWARRLAHLPTVLDLPLSASREHAGPLGEVPAAHRCVRIPLGFDRTLTAAIQRVAVAFRTTPFAVVMTALNAVLARYAGTDDVAIGAPVSNRHRAQTADIVGFVADTLVLRTDLAGDPPFAVLLERVRDALVEDFRHQDLPFDEVVKAVNPERRKDVSPLFQVLFVFQTMAPLRAAAGRVQASAEPLPMPTARADLVVELYQAEQGIAGGLEYREGLIDPGVARGIADALPILLSAALGQPDLPLSLLPLQAPDTGRALLASFNPPQPATAEPPATLATLFMQRARQTPDAVALIDGERTVSCAELDRSSAALAARLAALGVTTETPVAICLPRSVELAVSILAVLRAGGAFLLLDPQAPAERQSFMLQDSAAPVLIANDAPSWLPSEAPPALVIAGQPLPDAPAPRIDGDPQQLAYICYTSGSSGPPKAVMGLHRGAVNRVRWMAERYPFEPSDVCCLKTTPTFVDFVWEFFGPLLAGVPSVIVPPADVLDPAAFARTLERHRVTRVVLVPSLLKSLLDHVDGLDRALRALRHCTTSGEALPVALARRFLALLPDCRLLNLYGSSETSADASFHDVTAADAHPVPIGRPIPGNLIAVVDRAGHPLPVGVAGEIVVGGAGVARGYWRRDDVTAERFAPIPAFAGERGFRTRDLGRWRADGTLDYLGRLDWQVKIRGMRVDPGEVRAALALHAEVRDAVVVARQHDDGDMRLIAYVVAPGGVQELALRKWMAAKLPAAMQPAAYVFLDQLPLNANGKVDHHALPAFDASAAVRDAIDAAPLTTEESLLADIWQRVLGVRPDGPHAQFFMLGGHSLAAVRLAMAVEASLGVRLPVTAVFDAPTLREFAAAIRDAQPVERLPDVVPTGLLAARASVNQERVWLIEQNESLRGAYNEHVIHRLRGALDAARLEQALAAVVMRHGALRTRLVPRDGALWQIVDSDAHWVLRRMSVRGVPDADARARAFIRDEAWRPFRLDREWPLRASLIEVGENDWLLALVLHHSACDGWSGGVIVDDMCRAYAGETFADQPAPVQHIDVAEWQQACAHDGRYAPQLAWWRDTLRGAPAALGLALDRTPAQRDYRLRQVDVTLDRARVEQLRRTATDTRTTVFTLLLGLWATVLARFGHDREVVIGIPVSGRNQPALTGVVGFLSNTIPLRVECDGEAALAPFAQGLQRRVLDAMLHQDPPFTQILDAAQVERVRDRNPLVQAMFVLSDVRPWALKLDDVAATFVREPGAVARADISLVLRQHDTGIEGAIEFAGDVMSDALASRIAAGFMRVIEAALDRPEQPLAAHSLLGDDERAALLHLSRQAPRPVAADAPVRLHDLLLRSAHRSPEAVAASTPHASIRYRELARRATAFAGRLHEAGVAPGSRVALIAERSIERLVALMGISMAGGVLIPVDPAYPAASVDSMLDDAQVAAVVTDTAVRRAGVVVLPMPAPLAEPDDAAAREAAFGITLPQAGEVACIIFTSGSTGRPKGVEVTHRALCRLAGAACETFAIEPESRILQLAAFGFDVAISDVAFAMAAGACLCLAPGEDLLPGTPLVNTLRALRITHLQIPASLLAATPAASLPDLDTLVVGGERCLPEIARAWASEHRLFVAYGPTEATVTVTAGRHAPDVPLGIGRPVGDAELHVIDARGEPVPIGVPGELHIGGPVVSPGYVNRPELTAERFVADRFSAAPGARLYRTGDLARWRDDGTLEFLGRMDRQLKLRGFRIEPGEVEAALLAQQGVEQAFVTLHGDAPDRRQLVAYVVCADPALDPVALRQRLRDRLPAHMVPTTLVRIGEMPLTAHGKIDVKRLPAPDAQPASPAREATGGGLLDDDERRVGALWRQVLNRSDVDPGTNFFDAGGHSLLIVKLHDLLAAEFAEAGGPLPISDLFRFPTIRSFAAYLKARRGTAEPATARVPADTPPTAPVDAPIAVIGMACRFPGAPDLQAYWQMLLAGREGISRTDGDAPGATDAAPRSAFVAAGGVVDQADCFDAEFFGLSPRDALTLDPQHRVALECAWHALEHAGYVPAAAPHDSVGVFLGVGINTYLHDVLFPDGALPEGADGYHALTGNDKDFAATRIAYHLNLKGPALAVQTACSSSLVAVDMACRALASGAARMALAGGVSISFPQGGGYRHEPGMILSPDGRCRAFSHDAKGTVPGAGVGMVLLKPLSAALADGDNVLAVIRGTAVNNDGAVKAGYAAPGVDGQAAVIAAALHAAHVRPDEIDYVEAHGTGTELGDPIEVAALTRVFAGREAPLLLGSVKSNIGHADSAAGVAGLIKTVLALHHRELPPSLHFSAPNPHIDFASARIEVVAQRRPWPSDRVRRAGVSAFGIGGTNVHAVLEEPPRLAQAPAQADASPQVLVVSARSEDSLASAVTALADALDPELAPASLDLRDVAYTLQNGRAAFAHRAAVVAGTREQAVAALRGLAQQGAAPRAERGEQATAFLFPGQGSQYPGMGRALYGADDVYRFWFDRCAAALLPHLGQDLRTLLHGAPGAAADGDALKQTALAQPALFSVMYALAQSALARGIEPAAMLGHSLGEYVAACLAGVFELEAALALVATRGRLMQALPGGTMLAVQIGEEAAHALLRERPGCELSLAAVNGADQCVFAGPTPAIAALQAHLQAGNRVAVRLETSHAFHSLSMDAMRDDFLAAFAGLTLKAPTRRFVSNVTGTWITDAEATDPAYWARHLREAVRFADGLDTLREAGVGVLLELGPGNALQKLARAAGWDAANVPPLGLARRAEAHGHAMLEVLARSWLAGARIDWRRHAGADARQRRKVALPGYAFARRRHWPAARDGERAGTGARLDKRADLADWFYLPGWQRAPQLAPLAAASPPDTWLLLGAEQAAAAALAGALRAAGQRVIAVEAGAQYATAGPDRFVVDPRSADHYRRLLADLPDGARVPSRIVHAWGTGVDADAARAPASDLDAFFSLLRLVRAIGALGIVAPLRIDIVTRGAADVTGAERLMPVLAPLLGAAKVIPLEYPNVRCRVIDVIDGDDAGHGMRALLQELAHAPASGPKTEIVALRGRHRWIPHLSAMRLAPPEPDAARLRTGGTYLVTGAFGAMGAAVARDLATTWRARLVLLGRHVDASLVETLQAAGSDVFAAACDVADAIALSRAIDAAQARFGRIDGVFHAAGVADLGGVIQNRDDASIAAAMAAKIDGTIALDELLAADPPDFMVLFSTLGSLFPESKFGQVGYAAANEFLDLYAVERSARTGRFTLAINWDDWADAGMTVAAHRRWGIAAPSRQVALSSGEGVAALARMLAAPHARVAVCVRDLPALAARMAQGQSPLGGLAPLHLPAAEPSPGGAPAAAVATAGLTATEAHLSVVWRQILGVDEIGKDDNFFDLGGHSLIAMRLLAFVREALGVELNIAAVFDHAVLSDLARHIDGIRAPDGLLEEFTL